MKSISAKNKGIIISFLMMLLSFIFYHLLTPQNLYLSRYLIISIFIVGLLWTLIDYKKSSNEASFKDLFNEGFKNFIVVTFFMALYSFIFYKIYPLPYEYENFILNNKELLLKEGNRTAKEINDNAAQWRNYFVPLILSFYNFTFLILGTIISGITSYVFSKKK
jgi:hypothetical protein